MAISKELIDTAEAYATHTLDCPFCRDTQLMLCPDGMELMDKFYSALREDAMRNGKAGKNVTRND